MKRSFFCILTLISVIILCGCASQKKTKENPGNVDPKPTDSVTPTPVQPHKPGSYFSNVTLPTIDNTKYDLKNSQIDLSGKGKSSDMERSRSQADLNANKKLKEVLDNTMSFIAEKRHLTPVSLKGLTVSNSSTVAEDLGYEEKNGRYVYHTTMTLRFEVETILKDLYKKMKPSSDYSWFAFCRDFDFLMSTINK